MKKLRLVRYEESDTIKIDKEDVLPLEKIFGESLPGPRREAYRVDTRDSGDFRGIALFLPRVTADLEWVIGEDAEGAAILVAVSRKARCCK